MRKSSKIEQPIVKLEDTFSPIIINTDTPSPSRQEAWWKSSGFDKIYKKFRKSKVESTILSRIKIEEVGSYFNLQGYVFGKWTTQGDRYNYLAATAVCFEDLNRVLKFRNNVGLNHHVGLSFGARGRGVRGKGVKPTAHYEPSTGVINLTRYKSISFYTSQGETPESHEYRFLYTGGVGALCHELGHAIDFYGGAHLDLDSKIFSLSGGMNIYVRRKEYKAKNNELRNLLEDVLAAACLNEQEDDFSSYYKRINGHKSISNERREYLLARTELVARLFEQYVAYKLKELGIVNTLLTQRNYKAFYYPTSKEFQRIVKPFDKFMLEFRKRLAGSPGTPLKPRAKKSAKPTNKPKPKTSRKKSKKSKGEQAPKPRVKNRAAKPKSKLTPKPQAATKQIKVALPVTIKTIDKYVATHELWNLEELKKMPDDKFLLFWKYILTLDKMADEGIYPSDYNDTKYGVILGDILGKGSQVINCTKQEFKRRGWDKVYSLVFAKKTSKEKAPISIPKPPISTTTQTVTVKIPVSLATLKKHLYKKEWSYHWEVKKMSDEELFLGWKYASAAQAMVKYALYPSDLNAQDKSLINAFGSQYLKEYIDKSFKERGLDKKYSFYAEQKEQSKKTQTTTTTSKPKRTTNPKTKPTTTAATKTITVKIPVTLQTLENHLWGKQLDKARVLSKMPEKEFLSVWKYVLAGNAMLKKGLNPSDLFNSNKHFLPQVAHDGIVELVNQEFKKRGWENKYSLFVEKKEQSNKPKKAAPKTTLTNKELSLAKLKELEPIAQNAWINVYSRYEKAAKDWMEHHQQQLLSDINSPILAQRKIDIKGYINKYIQLIKEELLTRSKCTSTAVVSAQNFSPKKAQQSNERLEKKLKAFKTWRDKLHKPISTAIKGGQANTVSLLEQKLAKLEQYQEKLKLTKKILKDKTIVDRRAAFEEHHIFSDITAHIRRGRTGDSIGPTAHNPMYRFNEDNLVLPAFLMRNNGANIRTIKKRINAEKQVSKKGNQITQYKGFKVVQNVEIQRIQIIFQDKPSPEVRAVLKKEGQYFKWTPTNKAWQRVLNAEGLKALEKVLKELGQAKASTPVKKK